MANLPFRYSDDDVVALFAEAGRHAGPPPWTTTSAWPRLRRDRGRGRRREIDRRVPAARRWRPRALIVRSTVGGDVVAAWWRAGRGRGRGRGGGYAVAVVVVVATSLVGRVRMFPDGLLGARIRAKFNHRRPPPPCPRPTGESYPHSPTFSSCRMCRPIRPSARSTCCHKINRRT